MGKALVEEFSIARSLFNQADDILAFPLSRLCFEGPESELNDTINTQVALYVTCLAALEALKVATGSTQPKYVAGHSMGEYTAYAAAGVYSFEDGLRLVRERGRLMKKAGELNSGSMAAILALDDDKVRQICQDVQAEGLGVLQIANYNCPGQVVISGHNEAVDRGLELARAAKAKLAVKLAVSIAAHSELMRVVADQFREAVNKTRLNLPEMPIVANITAEPLTSTEAIRIEMEGQLTSSTRWSDAILWMIKQEVTTFVEIGPKSVLTSFTRRMSKQVATFNIATPEDIQKLLDSYV